MMSIMRSPVTPMACALVLLSGPLPSQSRVVGITVDVEGHIQSGGSAAVAVLDAMKNATTMLRAAPELGLRFSAATQVSWAFHPVVYPPGALARPGHDCDPPPSDYLPSKYILLF